MRKHIDPSETILMLSILVGAVNMRLTVCGWHKRQLPPKRGRHGPTLIRTGRRHGVVLPPASRKDVRHGAQSGPQVRSAQCLLMTHSGHSTFLARPRLDVYSPGPRIESMEFAKILFGQPLPPAALPWRTPKVTSHAPGQVLTMIIDHRQRPLAFMATRDVVVVRHCGLAAFPPKGVIRS